MPEKVFIDRDELLELAKGTDAYFQIKSILTGLPAVDAVEVVRCKDCKNYSNFDAEKAKRLDFHFCKKFNNITRENDFCSYGERKGAE